MALVLKCPLGSGKGLIHSIEPAQLRGVLGMVLLGKYAFTAISYSIPFYLHFEVFHAMRGRVVLGYA